MNQTLPPSDPLLWEALPELNLNIAQTAELCGISVRQLGYWTHQGYIAAQGKGTRRTYGLEAVRQLLAIRKAMVAGLSLRQALRAVATPVAPIFDASPAAVSPPSLSPPSLSPAESAALLRSLQSFFAANSNTRDTAGGLAIKLGRSEEDVRTVAESLCEAGILIPMLCQGLTIFRQARQEGCHV